MRIRRMTGADLDAVDAMERVCGRDWWPVPSYNKMLFYV